MFLFWLREFNMFVNVAENLQNIKCLKVPQFSISLLLINLFLKLHLMISIPFYYPKDKNLKILVQFDNWFSMQKDFTLRHNGQKINESEVVDDVFVAKAGEKYYAIRFEPNFLTPTLYIDKEPFVLGEKLKWYDYVLAFSFLFSTIAFPSLVLGIHSNISIFMWPILYYVARYISLSRSMAKRSFMWMLVNFLIGFALFIEFQIHKIDF